MRLIYRKFGLLLPAVIILILGLVGFTLAQIGDGEPAVEVVVEEPVVVEPVVSPSVAVETVEVEEVENVPAIIPEPPVSGDVAPVEFIPPTPEVELAPEFTIIKSITERYVFEAAAGYSPVVEVGVVDDRGALQLSGSCSDAYYVILLFRGAEDYITERSSFLVNRAYPCEAGRYSYTISNASNLPTNLDGEYHLLIGEQGETGPWRAVSEAIPVQIHKEITETETKVPVARANPSVKADIPTSTDYKSPPNNGGGGGVVEPSLPPPTTPIEDQVIVPPPPADSNQPEPAEEIPAEPINQPPPPAEETSETSVEVLESVELSSEPNVPSIEEGWQVFEAPPAPPPPAEIEEESTGSPAPVSIWKQWWSKFITLWRADSLVLL